MNAIAINAFSGEINNQQTTLVNGEELHAYLGIQTRYSDWILRRIKDYEFVESLDFTVVRKFEQVRAGQFFGKRGVEKTQYHLTLDMAKELCMVERSEIGRAARRYFIEIEKEHREAMPQWAVAQLSQAQFQRDAAVVLAYSVNPKLPAVREFVRLLGLGLSHREVALLLGVGETTVGRMSKRLQAAGMLGNEGTAGFPLTPCGGEPTGSSNGVAVQASLPHLNG